MPNPWVKDFALILPSTTWWPKAKSPGLINNSLAKAKAFGSRKGLRQESLGLRQVLADCLWKSHKKSLESWKALPARCVTETNNFLSKDLWIPELVEEHVHYRKAVDLAIWHVFLSSFFKPLNCVLFFWKNIYELGISHCHVWLLEGMFFFYFSWISRYQMSKNCSCETFGITTWDLLYCCVKFI